MESNYLSVVYFGLLPVGFTSYPKQFSKHFEIYNKSKNVGDIECFYIMDSNETSVVFIYHGIIGESNFNEPRGGRSFGFCIKLDGKKLSEEQISKVFNFMQQVFYAAIFNASSGIFKENLNIPYFRVYSFEDIQEHLDHVTSQIKIQFPEQLGELEHIGKIPERVRIDLYPKKVEKENENQSNKKNRNITPKDNDKNSKNIEINNLKDKFELFGQKVIIASKNQAKLIYILLIWSLFLTSISVYLLYQRCV